jgi:hypothetical protein
MTEVVEYTTPSAHPAIELVRWADAARSAFTLAESLVKTNVCPPPFRGKPAEATAVVLLGAELGLSPIAALRSMYDLRGQIGMYVRAQVALVQSRGHSIWTEHETDDMVTVAGHRRGEPDHVERVTWTIARARQAGYIRRGRDNTPSRYELDPRTMLWSRAAGDVARRIAADVLAGIPELDDPGELVDVGTRAPGAATTRVQRQPRPVSEVELPPPTATPDDAGQSEDFSSQEHLDEPDVEDELPVETDGEPLVTPAQRRMLHPLLIENGVRGSDARHAWLAEFLGHDVESTNDLTVTEASAAIDELQRLRDRRGES